MPHNDGFFYRGGRIGCLLLHGFTASPQEMWPLGQSLHDAGHTVLGVRLAGHGTSVTDLDRTSWREWLDSARNGLAALRPHADTTVVIGLSMGALLALNLAHDHPGEVHALALLSSALLIRERRLERYLPLLRVTTPLLPRRWRYLPKQGRDIADPVARAAGGAYTAMPLRSLVEFIDLQRHTRPMVRAIRQPVLAIHAREDHTCGLDNIDFLRRQLPTPPTVELLDASFHVVTLDYDKERVAQRVCAFVASAGAAARPCGGRER